MSKFTAPKGKYKISGHIGGTYFEREATTEECEHFDSTSYKAINVYESEYDKLQAENAELKTKLEIADKVLSERCCIDDCGFDVYTETRETLQACMIAIDEEAREALDKIRG